ncbi:helix-turn-helix transcriptional regulator [Paenibacillus sp. Leaf72]|uniref:helix-turn-helix transcriptional regulator n=1 Tax=Paenibacillus sp. Leaf72 TaxID=1736234 RepID=UPI0009D6BFD0|nr:helix-turn-helix transcriptional regulator [Paenibacillus sp. Leaf72]
MGEIGYRIKCIRKENNQNQSQFAKAIGISQGNLSEIEMGNSNPSASATYSTPHISTYDDSIVDN